MNIKKEDTVVVIAGNDKGKKGKVLQVIPKQDKILVEGINIKTKHVKPKGKGQEGGIIKTEMPIHKAKVMLVCPKCGKPSRIGKQILDNGNKTRICKKCNEPIK